MAKLIETSATTTTAAYGYVTSSSSTSELVQTTPPPILPNQCPTCMRQFSSQRGLSLHYYYYYSHRKPHLNTPRNPLTPEQREITRKLDALMVPGVHRDESQMSSVLGSQDLVQTLSAVYLLEDLALDYTHLKPLASSLTTKTMQSILDYLVMATLGEARHIGARTLHGYIGNFLTDWFIDTVRRGHEIRSRNNTVSRGYIWYAAYEMAKIVGYEETLNIAHDLHNLKGVWGNSYGGPKWAAVTELGLDFALGRKSSILALDSIVDIVHNGGWAFNKYYGNIHACGLHGLTLKDLLNLKAENARSILNGVCLPTDVKKELISDGLIYRIVSSSNFPSPHKSLRKIENRSRFELGILQDEDQAVQDSILTDASEFIHDIGGYKSWSNMAHQSVSSRGFETWSTYYDQTGHPPTVKEYQGWYIFSVTRSDWKSLMVSAINKGYSPKETIQLLEPKVEPVAAPKVQEAEVGTAGHPGWADLTPLSTSGEVYILPVEVAAVND